MPPKLGQATTEDLDVEEPLTFVLVDRDGTPLVAVPVDNGNWREAEAWCWLVWRDHERRRTMNDVCICGHAADDHEDDGIGLCKAVGCPCAGFELDLEEDVDGEP